MSTLTILSLILISTTELTLAKPSRLGRIDNDIKNIDLKLHAYSHDILTLKNDVADTNEKLDLILDIMNNITATPQHASHDNDDVIDTSSENKITSDLVSSLNAIESNVKGELNRVRRAFATQKKNLLEQQKRNTIQFFEFADKLNDTLAILHDRFDTKWTVNAINDSVVSVLGTVRDDIDDQLVLWNQSIHDNLKEHTNTTLATLNVLTHVIASWNESSPVSLNADDLPVINMSLIYDNLTKTLQTKLISSLTEIEDSVRSIDYSDTLSNIVDSVQSHATKVEGVLNNHPHFKHDTVRLVNSTRNKGRLEVYVDGKWGTVCDDSFSNTDASVVCRMVGYSSGISKEKAYFGQGTLPIVLDEVECTGTEYSIQECSHTKAHDCSHSEDVGVICSYSSSKCDGVAFNRLVNLIHSLVCF